VTPKQSPFTGERTVRELILYCDGGSRGNPGPSAIGAVVFNADHDPPEPVASVSERIGITTNNVAEYRALIAGLEAAAGLGARTVHVRADSLLMIKQLRGEYRVKNPNLKPLHTQALRLLAAYETVDLQHVPREENTEADALVNAALDAT